MKSDFEQCLESGGMIKTVGISATTYMRTCVIQGQVFNGPQMTKKLR